MAWANYELWLRSQRLRGEGATPPPRPGHGADASDSPTVAAPAGSAGEE